MEDPQPPTVTLAEFKQQFRWTSLLAIPMVGFWFLALHMLRAPDISPNARLLWCMIPIPLMLIGFWQMIREKRRQSEMERRVTGEAIVYAFYLSIAFYAVMGLVGVAYPIDAETWASSWVYPMLISAACWMVVYRRYNPR